MKAGVPSPVAAKLMGHADSRTTERWYLDMSAEERAEIARRMPI